MQKLFNITDQLNEFWMLEAKVSTTLEKVPAVRQDNQPVLSTTVPYTTCTGTRS